MKFSITRDLVALIAVLVCSGGVRAATFTENFDDGTLDPALSVVASPGFSATVTGGGLAVTKAEGTGNGDVKVETGFDITGDFVASVRTRRISLHGDADMGLLVSYGSSGFANVFFICEESINANISSLGSVSTADTQNMIATFRASRAGNSLMLDYDIGTGFQVLHTATDPSLAGPVRIELFLIQRHGNTILHSGTFDDFVITTKEPIGPPTPPPAGTGRCADGSDNDGDGLVDCADPGCAGDAACAPAEICGNCRDDDGNGRTDFEDPACCGQKAPEGLSLTQGRITASRFKLKGSLPNGTPALDPAGQDVFLQLRSEAGGQLLCARIPAGNLKAKKRSFKFLDRGHALASAQGLDKLVLKTLRDGRIGLGAGSVRPPFQTPEAGPLRITVGLLDTATGEGGARCISTTREFRGQGGRKTLRFP